ncbi:MAG: hypothetical protein K0R75_2958, partial [Paenibacillaceae bacterium]|nr:hypothetical protein [Paenibacillaceae bacterium]
MNFHGNWLTSQSIRYKFVRLLAALICIIILFVVPFSIYLVNAQNALFVKQEQLQEKAKIVGRLGETINSVIFHARGYYAYQLDSELTQARSLLVEFNQLIDDYSALPLTEQELKLRDGISDFSKNYETVLLPKAVALVNSGDFEGLQEFASGDGGKEINRFLAFTQSYTERMNRELSQAFQQAEKRTNQWIFMAMLFSGLILFVFVAMMWRILHNIFGPLSDLGDAAEALIHGQNVELKELRRKDEIGQLSKSFNHMVRSLQDKEEELLAQNEELTSQQDELQSNQERLQRSLTEIESMTKALDQSSAVAILDRDFVFQYVNNKLCEWTLYNPAELIGRSYLMLTMPGSEGAVVGEIGRIARRGGTWSGDILNRRRDGSGLWLQSTLVPYVDSKGIIYQYIMIANNISPLKQTEEELARSLTQTEKTKEELEVYNQLNRELTSTLDRQEFAESFLAHINKLYSLQASLFLIMKDKVVAAKGLDGESIEAFAKESMNGLYVRLSEERSFVVKREASVSEQGIAAGSLVYSYDFYSGVAGPNHELTGMFCATRIGRPFLPEEINAINGQMNRVALALERINLFGAIERSRKLNRNIINNVLEGIQFVDPEGHMLQSNNALCRMLGRNDWANEERIGKEEWISCFTKHVRDERALRQFFDKALSSPVTDDYTLQYTLTGNGGSVGSGGPRRHMEVYATSLFQQAEKIGTIFVHRD